MSKCDKCKNRNGYNTGIDEYPPYTYLEYCLKWHWQDNPNESDTDEWDDCQDYKEVECE